MADKDIDYDVLGSVINTTFGRSSTDLNVVSGYSVIFSFGPGGTLLAKFNAIVNFGTELEQIRIKRRYEADARDVIKLHLDRLKREYKAVTGDTLSFKEVDAVDSLEMLSGSNVRRTARFLRIATIEMN